MKYGVVLFMPKVSPDSNQFPLPGQIPGYHLRRIPARGRCFLFSLERVLKMFLPDV